MRYQAAPECGHDDDRRSFPRQRAGNRDPMPAVETVTKAFFPSSRKFIASSSFSLLRFVYVVDSSFPAQMIDREAIVRPARQQQVVNRCVKHLYAKRFPIAAQRCAEYECGNQQPAADQGKARPQPERQQKANDCLGKWQCECE